MAELLQDTLTPGVKRKRPRAARACEACRAKKYRCDELYPCSKCKKQKVTCAYNVADGVRQRLFQSVQSQSQMEVSPSVHALPRHNHVSDTGSNELLRNGDVTPSQPHVEDGQMGEVSDVNPHTHNPEFHGKTSSIAFLAALRPQSPTDHPTSHHKAANARQQSLVSIFHNEAFSPDALIQAQQQETKVLEHERYYFRQAHAFLDGFFQNLHFIHPILDREIFMSQCEHLWFGRSERLARGFVSLYYSIMSLGALIRTWDEPEIAGMGRLEWSRRFFNLARLAHDSLRYETSVESVQCLFFLAKVSQNELNPSVAYMYLGWATRACFSAGFNRRRTSKDTAELPEDKAISRLFWGLYSLEIETSFALGRPDSLGSDAYHNQLMPSMDEGETSIITIMVSFTRIVREVSESIYLSNVPLLNKPEKALQIEDKMLSWLRDLPESIRPSLSELHDVPSIAKDPIWAKRQRLVLKLRFYNVKMVLYRPFLVHTLERKHIPSSRIAEAVSKCVDAAKSTIVLMHEMYCSQPFFRTWFYNTTYILYAASIVLCYGTRVASKSDADQYLELGSKTVEILEAMEESIVAKNSARMVNQILASAKRPREVASQQQKQDDTVFPQSSTIEEGFSETDPFLDDSLAPFLDLGSNLDFLNFPYSTDAGQMQYWNDFETANA